MDEFTGADLDYIDELDEVMATVNTDETSTLMDKERLPFALEPFELSPEEEKTKVFLEHFKSQNTTLYILSKTFYD